MQSVHERFYYLQRNEATVTTVEKGSANVRMERFFRFPKLEVFQFLIKIFQNILTGSYDLQLRWLSGVRVLFVLHRLTLMM